MKKFSSFEIMAIKRTAQNIQPILLKKAKLAEKIDTLNAEYNKLQITQDKFEAPIKELTGGFTTEDLVEKVVEVKGEDKNGNPIKQVKYVLKYPDTIVPESPIDNTVVDIETVDSEEAIPEVEAAPGTDPMNIFNE